MGYVCFMSTTPLSIIVPTHRESALSHVSFPTLLLNSGGI